MAETFDSWDRTAKDGNDTEANVVVLVLCIGVTLATGTIIVVNQIRAHAFGRPGLAVDAPLACQPLVAIAAPAPTASPPTILRV